MNNLTQLVVFRLEGQRYALLLEKVERIVRAVEVTPLPKAPFVVLGIINLSGTIIPVFDLRRRLKLLERNITPSDQFIIARTSRRRVVIVVDTAEGVVARPAKDFVDSSEIVAGRGEIQGIVKLPDGLALIHDLEKFLSADEIQMLDKAMSKEAGRAG